MSPLTTRFFSSKGNRCTKLMLPLSGDFKLHWADIDWKQSTVHDLELYKALLGPNAKQCTFFKVNNFYHHINFCIEDILKFLTITFTEWLILFIQ